MYDFGKSNLCEPFRCQRRVVGAIVDDQVLSMPRIQNDLFSL
jgi:hypothetical protein